MSRRQINSAGDIPALSGVNFYSTMSPLIWCAMTAYEMERCFGTIFSRPAAYSLAVAALFVLPMLFITGSAAYLMAKFPCRNIISCAKVAELMTSLLQMILYPLVPVSARLGILIVTTLLLGIEYAIYRPALRCYIASTLPKKLLGQAVGKIQGAALFGAGCGVAVAVLGRNFAVSPVLGWLFFACCSANGLRLATRIRTADALQPRARYTLLRHLRRVRWDRQILRTELRIASIGETFCIALLILMLALAAQYFMIYLENRLSLSQFGVALLIIAPLLGGAGGCLLGGKLSGERVETGLVPGFGLLAVLLLAGLGAISSWRGGIYEYLLLGGGLYLFGLALGVVMVPLQAFQEFFVKKDLLPAFFAGFYRKFGLGALTGITAIAISYYHRQPVVTAAYALAFLTLVLLSVACRLMPQILLRAGSMLLLKTLYRLRVVNPENIPDSGPALLVCNRSSFVDVLFITGATSRPVRFMMYEGFCRKSWLLPWFNAAGFLEVPSNKPKKLRQLFEKTRYLLRRGEIICVFPEEDITKNGVMSGFRDGMKEMLPDDMDVPVIPLHIGMTWGSIFSCFYGKFKLRWPDELPHHASITVGEAIPPDTSAYEIRIILSELAAETEALPPPGEWPFHSRFVRLAKRDWRGSFISEFSDGRIRTPRHLDLLSRCILLSRFLRRRRRGEYVGIMLPNSIAFFEAFTAVLMADRIPAILNYTASAAAREYAVQKSGLQTVITSRALLEKTNIPAAPGMIFIEDMEKIMTAGLAAWWWKALAVLLPTDELMKLISPYTWDDIQHTAVVLFSSGSTGIPKGIMLSHHNIFTDIQSLSRSIAWSGADRVPGNLPLFHSFGMAVCLWMPLYYGSRVVMLANPLDAESMGEVLRRSGATVLFATPSFLQIYMRRCRPEDFKTLRLVIAGAEKLRDDIADKFREMTGLVIAEAYGCTELSPVVSVNLANSVMELGVEVARHGSIGPSLPGICAKIVDPSTFELLPEDEEGLLLVKGAIVMQGYINDESKTSEAIRDGWYVTGDIGRMDRNGFITLTGRLSRFSKIAGEMVPHELVEREINNIIRPDQRILAVTGMPDADKGEKLVVFYTDSELLAPEQVIRQLRERRIPNLWIPRAGNFIKVDSLPLLGSGKLDLAALKKLAESFAGKA